jgi:hypothetical protein
MRTTTARPPHLDSLLGRGDWRIEEQGEALCRLHHLGYTRGEEDAASLRRGQRAKYRGKRVLTYLASDINV